MPNINIYLSAASFMITLRGKQGSLKSMASGLRAWAAFCDALAVPHFPVDPFAASQFCCVFRDPGTYAAYVAHLKSACALLGFPTDWAECPKMLRARKGLEKAALVFKGPRLAVQGTAIARFALRTIWTEERFFCILSWCFMLRASNEASALVRDPEVSVLGNLFLPLPEGVRGAIGLINNTLCIRLRTRKNHIFGDCIRRSCTCVNPQGVSAYLNDLVCPVHVLRPWVMRKAPPGHPLFGSNIARRALIWLRIALEALDTPQAKFFGLHSLRRGAAQQLVAAGGDLATLLRAGGWRSSAFKSYLDMIGLENRVITATLHSLVDLDQGSDA